MATESVNTSLTQAFDSGADDTGKLPIKITNDYGFRFGATVQFRVWPSVGATVIANYGIVWPISSGHVASGSEYVTFSNSDTASTEYPISSGSVSQAGPGIDKDGNLVSVSFTIENGQIKASQPFYGGAFVSYSSTYSVWGWSPVIPGSSWWNRVPSAFNYAIQIFAFYEGSTATYSVEYGTVEVNNYAEAYRVTSEYIADSEGQWEVPPDWPDNNDYPNDNQAGPDSSSYQQLERTHEVMTINTNGSSFLDRQWVSKEKPYTNSNLSYNPDYKFTKGSVPEEFQVAFLDLPWGNIQSDLVSRYPGITGF